MDSMAWAFRKAAKENTGEVSRWNYKKDEKMGMKRR